jgi:hypothetical protein
MKKCKDIENDLPLYDEGVLSAARKQVVEEHLACCAACRKELACLRKTSEMMDHLPAVEEPPWFQQKIMAGVREEAGKKSFIQKWFYPLRIKIPVQIMATVVIAVLAVYIYRSGDEQVRQILPQAPKPAMEMQKEQTPVRLPQDADRAAPMPPRKEATVRNADNQDRQALEDKGAGRDEQKLMTRDRIPQTGYDTDTTRTKAVAQRKDEVFVALPSRQHERPAVSEQLAESVNKTKDHALAGMAKSRRADKMAVPAAPGSMAASVALPSRADVLLEVGDLNAAAAELEKSLAKYDARKVTKQWRGGSLWIQAKIEGKVWKNVIAELKGIGAVKEKVSPVDIGERDITLLIEISGR